ncbi:MAG TPA: SRPBCC domain-containing protein [Dyella sp.]|uniref:SRPBCC family protein n=1 Tax=Dyella sp. TaxID=1869338 RepID=UPI002C4F4798|nr:SRPBCC domain-containing protein [Dyella sp.]HUB91383.1 SRPBCC domain-containing protein [Dyella sp.]
MTTPIAMPSNTVVQSIAIAAGREAVWRALIDPRAGEKWRMADFRTDWAAGSSIEIEAMIGDRRYCDKGRVLRVEPPSLLQYAYWSRISGLPDQPQSYSTITLVLEAQGDETVLTVRQAVPPSPHRRGRDWEIGPASGLKHVEFYWRTTLPVLKSTVESLSRT